MTKENCFELGSLIKPHGLKGDIQAFWDTDNIDLYLNIESILVEQNGQLVPFFVENLRPQVGQKVILKLEGIDTIEQAEEFRKLKLFLPDEFVPKLEDDEFFYHEIIGFVVSDTEKGKLGKIETIYNLPQNDLLVINYKEKEILIPLKKELIKEFDRENKSILMHLPEGLLEVYLEDTDQAEK
ncbi:ribosome maturation factor RimM [Bernardetia sp.]|uniref:ribosome maturation factor RimM n=1 Tax=Bernardetia sp. TaxID=1937974 RepID=UPI0025C39D78|nr:ribosome maturation factor RimM [Bernardetia sp.]